MKILTIGNFGHGWDGSVCDEEHIASALEELGHEVTRWQRENIKPGGELSIEHPVDFVLIAQWDGYVADNFVEWIRDRALGAPVVYWAFDYQNDGQEWHERLVKEADLYLSKRIADSKYPNWRWLSQDFAPKFLFPLREHVEKDIDVLFTGSYLDWAKTRNDTLKAVDNQFNLTIHSVNEWPGFKDQRAPIMDDGLPELYARAKVVLSIDHTLEAGYWSDRNAQIMCCGVRPLFAYIPLSEVHFGNHVDYFYSIDDCLEKVQQRLDNPIPLDTGLYTYAQKNLKVINRVQDLLTIVESIL